MRDMHVRESVVVLFALLAAFIVRAEMSAVPSSVYVLPDGFKNPSSLTVGPDGSLYLLVSNEDDPQHPSRIMRIDKTDEMTLFCDVGFFTEKNRPLCTRALEFGNDGHLYVISQVLEYDDESRLMRVNIVDGKPAGIDPVVGKISRNGRDLAVIDGAVVVTDDARHSKKEAGNKLFVFTSERFRLGTLPPHLYTGINAEGKGKYDYIGKLFKAHDEEFVCIRFEQLGIRVSGVAADSEGNIYVGDSTKGNIWKCTRTEDGALNDKTLFLEGAASGLKSVEGVYIDDGDHLWATDKLGNTLVWADIKTGESRIVLRNEISDGRKGELRAPVDCVRRGNKLYVANAGFGQAGEIHSVSILTIEQ